MSKWRLDRIWLAEVGGECASQDALDDDLQATLDLDTLNAELVSANELMITVGIAIELSTANEDEVVCDLAGSFRLLYTAEGRPDPVDLEKFSSEQGLADTWPVWKTWATQSLSLMGLAAAELPGTLPDEMIALGLEIFGEEDPDEGDFAGLFEPIEEEEDSD